MATYVNDLRLKEIATGDESGTWGTSTNTNLELIGEALGYGSQDCFSSDANATTTVADGATDPARALYFKVTSSATLSATRELTIAPNTVSRVMIIENATTGSQIITIKQGSGNTVNVGNGAVKVLYLDGAGAGAAVQDALVDLDLTGTTSAVNLDISGNIDVDGTTNLDAVDIDGAVQIDNTVTVGADDTGYDVKFFGATASAYMLWDESADDLKLVGAAGLTVAGDIDVDGTTNLDAVDIDGAVQIDSTVTVGADDTGYDVKFFGATASAYMLWDESADDLKLVGAAGLTVAGDIDIDGTTNLDAVDIDGAVQIDSTLTVGVDDTGHDVKFFGATSGAYMLWDESTDDLILGGASRLGIGTTSPSQMLHLSSADTPTIRITDTTGTVVNLELLSADSQAYMGTQSAHPVLFTTSNTERMRIGATGNATFKGRTGFGYTSESAAINPGIQVLTGGIGGGVQLNREVGANPSSGESLGSYAWKGQDSANTNAAAECLIDAITTEDHSGSTAATKMVFQTKNTGTGPGNSPATALTLEANQNATFAGEVAAASLDISGNVDVDGTLETDAFSINGTTVSSTAAELNVLDPALKENSSIWIGSDPTGNTGYGAASYNTAVGVEAGEELTTGDYNTAVGFRAGGGDSGAAVTAGSNTSVGAHALEAITTGDLNVAIGVSALRSSVLACRNVAIGNNALYAANPASKTNTYNIAIGLNAAVGLTTGIQNTFVGSLAGTEITTGNYNTHVGYNSGGATSALAYSGHYNTSIGINSLTAIRAASNNTALGSSALQVLSSGDGNVAVGGYAGDAITDGDDNTLVGYQSGTSLTGSAKNTAVGHSALYSTTTGDLNIAVGYKALYDNTVGDRNLAIGYEALRDLEPASNADMYNVALGFKAGTPASAGTAFTGTHNTLLGSHAGAEITTGLRNTAVGFESGGGSSSSAVTGSDNVSIGVYAAKNLTSADQNVYVGNQAGEEATTAEYNTAVGYKAGGGGSDAAATGNYNAALGFTALKEATTGGANTAIGGFALQALDEGSNNAAVGYKAGYSVTSGGNNLFLGKDAGLTGSPGGSITTGSNEIVLGDENITEAHIQVDWTVASDARDKTDFTALDVGLDFVKALKPVTYKWDKRSKYGDKTAADYDLNAQTPDGTHKEDWLDIGFKAQEVEALEIAAGYTKDNKTNLVSSHSGDGNQMGLQYSKFVPILVKAVQEQQALIESLTARIAALES